MNQLKALGLIASIALMSLGLITPAGAGVMVGI